MVPGMGRLFRSDRPVPPASASPPLLRDFLRGHPRRALVGFRVRVRARVPGTRHPHAAPHPTVGALPPFSRPRRSGPGGLPGTSRGAFSSARRSGSSIAPPSAPRRGPTAPCAWVWICPRPEEPRLFGHSPR